MLLFVCETEYVIFVICLGVKFLELNCVGGKDGWAVRKSCFRHGSNFYTNGDICGRIDTVIFILGRDLRAY